MAKPRSAAYVDLDVRCGHVTEKIVEWEDFMRPENKEARKLITSAG